MAWNSVVILTGDQGPQGPAGATGAQGATGSTGSQGPQGVQGATGSQGSTGSTGSTGPAGVDGRTVLSGAGAPSGGTGANGDFYVNTSAATIYGPKTAGAWGSATSLVGPTGAAGSAGADGADGQGVPTGGATGTLLAKTSGANFATAWSTPASLGLELVANKGVANGYCGLASNGAVAVGNLPGASPSAYGVLLLAGDLAGTAAAPTVPGLAGKASTTHAAAHAYGGSDPLPVVMFQGRATATQTLAITTFTAILLSVEDVDSHNGHSTVTNTSRFTVPIAGWYTVSCLCFFASSNSGTRELYLYKNGVQINNAHAYVAIPSISSFTAASIPGVLVYCAVNDYIEMYAKSSIATTTYGAPGPPSDGPYLSVVSQRLGAQ